MKFKFELEPVLGHRERIEQERAAEHSRALKDLLAAERARDTLLTKRDELRGRLVGQHASFDAETLRATYMHLDYLDRAIVAAQQRCDACADETERARQRLVDAAKDRKVLETLKDRRREAFELDAALVEQRDLDDQNARAFERAPALRRIHAVIVTRQRRRRTHAGRILIFLFIVAVTGVLLGFPPTQRMIANGPLRPLWLAGTNVGNVVVRPLSFAGQQATITDRNREIRDLDARLEQQRRAKAEADARAQALQQQLTALANQPHTAPLPPARPAVTPAPAFGDIAAGGASGATVEEKRLAATWAAMEPEKAAAVVQRLPDAEVTRVLAQMDTDAAGAIMDALPPAVAARISRAVAQVRTPAGR